MIMQHKTPENRTPTINPADWRIDTCERCGKPDAVKRRTKRRPCTSCRLRIAAAHAMARAKILTDAADRAFLQRRQLVMDVEDARTALVEARHATRDAGVCEAPRLQIVSSAQARSGGICYVRVPCDELRPFKLRLHLRAGVAPLVSPQQRALRAAVLLQGNGGARCV